MKAIQTTVGAFLAVLTLAWMDTRAETTQANTRRPLRCVYFTPADYEPCPDRAERLYRVMSCVRDFYRSEMERNGFGPLTFSLETEGTSPERLRLYEVRGAKKQAEYGRKSFGAVKHEVDAALKAQGLDVSRERMIVFQRGLKWANGAAQEISSYVGSWDSGTWGMCTVYDDPLLDPQNFPSKKPGGSYCGRPCSIGQFNTHYIGGIAHELGHALTLPHDGETPTARKTLGRSLMGAGNHSFGRELRGEGLGTILTPASALRLSAVSTINGEAPAARTNDVRLLTFDAVRKDGGQLQVKGRIATGRPVRGLIVYVDPDTPKSDYDAQTWIVMPDAAGAFDTVLDGVPAGESEIRVWVVRDCDSIRLQKSRLGAEKVGSTVPKAS